MLSVAFLVRNPPMDRFAALIEYLRIVATEVVIVDTGSSPEDIETMRSWSDRFDNGVKVIESEWENDFAKARNIGLAACTQEWTLVVDPDEIPSVGMISHIAAVLRNEVARPSAKGWLYWTINYWGGVKGPEKSYHWHTRLFKTGHGKFYRKVHELVSLDGAPEETTRGTSVLPNAPALAYLIHSKAADKIAEDDALYARLGKKSR